MSNPSQTELEKAIEEDIQYVINRIETELNLSIYEGQQITVAKDIKRILLSAKRSIELEQKLEQAQRQFGVCETCGFNAWGPEDKNKVECCRYCELEQKLKEVEMLLSVRNSECNTICKKLKEVERERDITRATMMDTETERTITAMKGKV